MEKLQHFLISWEAEAPTSPPQYYKYLTNDIYNIIAGIVRFVFLRHSAPIRSASLPRADANGVNALNADTAKACATGQVPEPDMGHSVPERTVLDSTVSDIVKMP